MELTNILIKSLIVKSFKEWTSWLGKLAHENPEWTKSIVGTVGVLAALKVGLTATKIGWNLLTLRFHTAKVAFDTLNVKILGNAKNMAEASKKRGSSVELFRYFQVEQKALGRHLYRLAKALEECSKI